MHKLICVYENILNDTSSEILSMFKKQLERRRAVEKSLIELHDVLLRSGVSYAVIKGISFERIIYGYLAVRDVGDIDILISARAEVAPRYSL